MRNPLSPRVRFDAPRPACVAEPLERRQLMSVVSGFTQSTVTSSLSSATSMDFAPDGRLFVCQQFGRLAVVKNGSVLPTPFLTLNVDGRNERGLLGVTFDPNFAANHFVYVYYTVPGANGGAAHNRISRFTANGDIAAAGSERVLMDLDPLSDFTNHNGGALHFGKDGKLYVSVGENHVPPNAQTLSNRLGKMLRINSDGSIPTDNPFYNSAVGPNRAIWAYGLRNPFTFAVQAGTGRIFINDVGENTWEEVNEGKAGANYGWPATEGFFNQAQFPNFTEPFYTYNHGPNDSDGCAMTGGTFYNPARATFPSSYVGKYFFADLCGGYVKVLDPANKSVSTFATGLNQSVDLDVGPDGVVYALGHGGTLTRFAAVQQPQTVALGASADSYVRDGQFANTNFGTGSQILTKVSAGAGYSRETYFTFDLSRVSSISHATLRLFGSTDRAGIALPVDVFAASSSSWSEQKLTWNNRPGSTGGALARATVSGNQPGWYTWDLTNYLRQQKAAGRNVVSFVLRNTAASEGYNIFNSKEAAGNRPELDINP